MTDISRYLEPQSRDINLAIKEILNGRKESHWMWYIFPQYIGLGKKDKSVFYAIQSVEEAKEFLSHPIAGANLRKVTQTVLDLNNANILSIFGVIDVYKLKSSMTLFSIVDENPSKIFQKVLDKYFKGQKDEKTIALLNI